MVRKTRTIAWKTLEFGEIHLTISIHLRGIMKEMNMTLSF